jgi:hypothetical protein
MGYDYLSKWDVVLEGGCHKGVPEGTPVSLGIWVNNQDSNETV